MLEQVVLTGLIIRETLLCVCHDLRVEKTYIPSGVNLLPTKLSSWVEAIIFFYQTLDKDLMDIKTLLTIHM